MVADHPTLLESFAANVRRLRTIKFESQQAFAEELGVDVRYLQRVERGQVNVGLATVERFSNALDVPASRLLRKAKLPEPKAGRPKGSTATKSPKAKNSRRASKK